MGELIAGKCCDEKNPGDYDGEQDQGGQFFAADFPTLNPLIDYSETKHASEQAGNRSYKCREGRAVSVHECHDYSHFQSLRSIPTTESVSLIKA